MTRRVPRSVLTMLAWTHATLYERQTAEEQHGYGTGYIDDPVPMEATRLGGQPSITETAEQEGQRNTMPGVSEQPRPLLQVRNA